MRTLFISIFTLLSVSIFGQVLIDDTNSSNEELNPSAILELRSKDKGFLLPNLTKEQRESIKNPAIGLMIYFVNKDERCLQIYNGTNWDNVHCSAGGNSAPLAQNVDILGEQIVGEELQGIYTYNDAENDTEGNSIYDWYIADDKQGSNAVSLNNHTKSYTIESKDLEKYIVFAVTPYATSGTKRGEIQYSDYIGPIIEKVTSPPDNVSKININEFHYDNGGGDKNEFVEIRVSKIDTPSDIADYKIVLYNGADGAPYKLSKFRDLEKSCDKDYCYYVWNVLGIQNGAKNEADGIVLVDASGNGIEFISYEGSFTAKDGPAKGMKSKDVGVFENGNTPENSSVYLDRDGVWRLSRGKNTKGIVNF